MDVNVAEPLPALRSVREETEWKTLSAKWREALSKLVNTLDTVNRNRHELERQKQLIRHALTTGKFDQIDKERAFALYQEWNKGIQMIPLYPEDYAPRRVNTSGGESVYLTPLAGPDGPEGPEPVSAYVYELDEGLLASQQKRDWIHVAPPALLNTSQLASNVIVAPPLTPGQQQPVINTFYPITGIAGWRVRRLGEGETLSFEDAITIATERNANLQDAATAANAIADAADRIKTINAPPSKTVVTETVNSMLRDTRAPFIPGLIDAYQFKFNYRPFPPTAVTTTVTRPVFITAPQPPPPTTIILPPPQIPPPLPLTIEGKPTTVILPPQPQAFVKVPIPTVPMLPTVPIVPEWRARQQQAAIASQYQRIYYPQDMPVIPTAPDYEKDI